MKSVWKFSRISEWNLARIVFELCSGLPMGITLKFHRGAHGFNLGILKKLFLRIGIFGEFLLGIHSGRNSWRHCKSKSCEDSKKAIKESDEFYIKDLWWKTQKTLGEIHCGFNVGYNACQIFIKHLNLIFCMNYYGKIGGVNEDIIKEDIQSKVENLVLKNTVV